MNAKLVQSHKGKRTIYRLVVDYEKVIKCFWGDCLNNA